MSDKKRIVFLFSDTGGGHRSATEAVMEAVDLHFGSQIETEMVDFFKDYCPWPFHRFPDMYPNMVKTPRVWGAGYVLSNGQRRARMIYRMGGAYVQSGFRRMVREHPCDLLVSVHPLANDAMLQALGSDRPPFTVIVTDLVTTHAFWYHPKADLTIVPTEPAYQRAIKYRLSPDKVRLVGLPVADRFCQPSGSRSEIRERLGWPQDLPVVVLVGGGDGMGPLEQTARAIANAGIRTGLVVVAGRNKALKARLEAYNWPIPTFIYGFVRDMPDFMRAADVLVTKAGPGTISEAFNAELPMILYSYLPGQETGNVTYVTENGAGVWAPKPPQIVKALVTWLEKDPRAYEKAREACKMLARPQSAREIAHILAQQVGIVETV